ncbi:hypothetical protein QBC39DRAFT_336736 [Podospora conica]|nr:hypothetical protein QBC39DRAFT_336736 [Schizothecium conicum]
MDVGAAVGLVYTVGCWAGEVMGFWGTGGALLGNRPAVLCQENICSSMLVVGLGIFHIWEALSGRLPKSCLGEAARLGIGNIQTLPRHFGTP